MSYHVVLAKKLWYIYDITDKPWPRPKPGQARPTFWLLAWPGIIQSLSRLKPGLPGQAGASTSLPLPKLPVYNVSYSFVLAVASDFNDLYSLDNCLPILHWEMALRKRFFSCFGSASSRIKASSLWNVKMAFVRFNV